MCPRLSATGAEALTVVVAAADAAHVVDPGMADVVVGIGRVEVE